MFADTKADPREYLPQHGFPEYNWRVELTDTKGRMRAYEVQAINWKDAARKAEKSSDENDPSGEFVITALWRKSKTGAMKV